MTAQEILKKNCPSIKGSKETTKQVKSLCKEFFGELWNEDPSFCEVIVNRQEEIGYILLFIGNCFYTMTVSFKGTFSIDGWIFKISGTGFRKVYPQSLPQSFELFIEEISKEFQQVYFYE